MKNEIYINKKRNDIALTEYHKGLVKHFYSLIPTGVRFVSDNNSGNLYECSALRSDLIWAVNADTLSFFNTKSCKRVDCNLVYKGELNLESEVIMERIMEDRQKVKAAYYSIAFN